MGLLNLPTEVIELILLKLDTQDIASCALVNLQLERLIYNTRFLDEYCRSTFGCSWLTVKDVVDQKNISAYKFWIWVYEAVKVPDLRHGHLILQSNQLTKIGILKHLFFTWLMCGYRSSFIDSHTLMNMLYPLPQNIDGIYESKSQMPETFIVDTLMKIFLWLPEIMEISYCNLKIFSMQKGPVSSSLMKFLYNTRVESQLPSNFLPLFSVEILIEPSAPAYYGTRNTAIIILFSGEHWVLWFGLPKLSENTPDSLDYFYFGILSYDVSQEDLKNKVQHSLQRLNANINGEQYGLNSSEIAPFCPIISFQDSDVSSMTILLAQEGFRTLKERFKCFLVKEAENLASDIQKHFADVPLKPFELSELSPEQRGPHPLELDPFDEYLSLSKITNEKTKAICKCLLQHIAYLFRNEIQRTLKGNFSHIFVCNCLGRSFPLHPFRNTNLKQKIDQCMANRHGVYPPQIWPPYVLSAASLVIPALCDIIQSDVSMMRSQRRHNIFSSATQQLMEKLKVRGLTLKARPPGKPRYPPIIRHLRLLTHEV